MTETVKYGNLSKDQFDAFLEHPFLARLATAVQSKEDPDYFQPHNTPVWFFWDGVSFYVSAFTSTRKMKEVQRNPFIALLIDHMDPVDGVTAVLVEGRAEAIQEPEFIQEMSRIIYKKYMGEGVNAPAPQSWIVDPENAIIKLTPKKVSTW